MQEMAEGSAAPGSAEELEIELAVGLRIEEYRWVEWSPGLGDAPIREPGRFVGHPGDLLAHLYVDASPDAPLGSRAYRHLPRYTSDVAAALRAAERAGVFRSPGALLYCAQGGAWRLSIERPAFRGTDECLPRLLCRAAVAAVDAGDVPEEP